MQLLQLCNSVVEINAAIRRGLRSDDNCYIDSSVVVTSPYAAYEVYNLHPYQFQLWEKVWIIETSEYKIQKSKRAHRFPVLIWSFKNIPGLHSSEGIDIGSWIHIP